jgi:DNA-binding protein HU-beta
MSIKDVADDLRALVPEITSDTRAREVVDALLSDLVNHIREADGKPFVLRGFGSFRSKHRPGRTGRNPSTGEPVKINARSTITFRPVDSVVIEGA